MYTCMMHYENSSTLKTVVMHHIDEHFYNSIETNSHIMDRQTTKQMLILYVNKLLDMSYTDYMYLWTIIIVSCPVLLEYCEEHF